MAMPAGQDAPATADELLKGLWRENPVFVQALGMCPALAVSNTAPNALAMGLATLFVLTASNAVISSVRRIVPKQVRIATYILVIATFVTVVDYAIQAISLDLHKALGAFISLIVVNCLILGRAEAFASKHSVGLAVADGLAWESASRAHSSAWAPCARSSARARSSACRSSPRTSSPGS